MASRSKTFLGQRRRILEEQRKHFERQLAELQARVPSDPEEATGLHIAISQAEQVIGDLSYEIDELNKSGTKVSHAS